MIVRWLRRYYFWVILVLLFGLIYFKTPFIFFIQDEWYGMGLMNQLGFKMVFHKFSPSDVNHFVPLDMMANLLSYKLFSLNYVGYNLIGLLIHLFNAVLVYLVVKLASGRVMASRIASLVFICSSVASQMVMWPLVSFNELTLTFDLLALIGFVSYIRGYLRLNLAISLVIFGTLLALLVSEYSIGSLLLFPLLLLVFRGSKLQPFDRRFLGFFILLVVSYLGLRVSIFPHTELGTVATFNLLNTIRTTIFLPFKFIGQITLTEPFFNFAKLGFDTSQILSNVSLVGRVNLLIGMGVASISLYLAWKFRQQSQSSKNILIGLLFLLTSVLPYVFLQGLSGGFGLFAPRYLYVGSAGVSLLLAFVIDAVFQKQLVKKWQPSMLKVVSAGGFLTLLIYLVIGILGNWQVQNNLYEQGVERQFILRTISNKYPILPEKVVFYTESDKPYYGLPEKTKILPFQSGFGHTLLVWYYPMMSFPKQFFEDQFLWGITDEGYQELDNRGFGYFRDLESLKLAVRENNLSSESVFGYSWNSRTGILTDISARIRLEVASDGS